MSISRNSSTESASTPISAGGWKYNPDDPQDVRDFAGSSATELAQYAAEGGYDFTQHPTVDSTPELSPEDLELLVYALTDYESHLRTALAGPSPGPSAAGRLVEALELARRLRADMLAERAAEDAS